MSNAYHGTHHVAVLLAVADQCPLTGGNAVFRARALYSLIDDTQEYDDALLCLQEGLITKRLEETVASACTVVPNPASDEATLVLPDPLDQGGQLVMYNVVGGVVLNMRIPADQLRTVVSTRALAPGIYRYRVRSTSGEEGEGNLTIIR